MRKLNNIVLLSTVPLLVAACFSGDKCEPNEEQICVDDKDFAEHLQHVLDNMVYVEPGSFLMGSNQDYDYEGPIKEIYLDGYYLSSTKHSWLTMEYFDQRSGIERDRLHKYSYNTDMNFNLGLYSEYFAAGFLYWDEANSFCQWLADETDLPFSLPSEAQWEKAAKAGNDRARYATDNAKLDFGRNFYSKEDLSSGKFIAGQTRSKYYPPNPYGFYEMSYNGGEWMLDGFVADYHEMASYKNPVMRPEDFNVEPGPTLYRTWRSSWSTAHDFELNNYIQSRKWALERSDSHYVRCALNQQETLPTIGTY